MSGRSHRQQWRRLSVIELMTMNKTTQPTGQMEAAYGGTLPRCLEENPADRSLWSVRHQSKSRAARVTYRGIAAATIDQLADVVGTAGVGQLKGSGRGKGLLTHTNGSSPGAFSPGQQILGLPQPVARSYRWLACWLFDCRLWDRCFSCYSCSVRCRRSGGARIINATGHPCIQIGSFRFAGILPRLPA
jgi:hypothetical protein